MHPALEGALVGLALGALLTVYEYYSVKKQVEERAAARHEKPQFEPTDKARINAVLRFALFLPPGGAVMFWLWSALT
jgi:hypothetical protein